MCVCVCVCVYSKRFYKINIVLNLIFQHLILFKTGIIFVTKLYFSEHLSPKILILFLFREFVQLYFTTPLFNITFASSCYFLSLSLSLSLSLAVSLSLIHSFIHKHAYVHTFT